MKLQLAAEIRWPPRDDDATTGEELLGRLASTEAHGFDGVWLMDPGNSAAGPSIHMAAAWLAARTRRITIGLRLALPVALHPIRLAEELAILDLMCDGRLDCSIAADPEAPGAASEQLEIALKAWTGETFSHAGEFFDVPELQCLPRPAREDGPPLWVATGHPPGPDRGALASWAATTGRPLWVDASVSEQSCAQLLEAHAQATTEAGHDPSRLSHRVVRRVRLGDEGASQVVDDTTICGDPAYCRDHLLALGERLQLDTLVCWLDGDPASHSRLAESMLS